MVLIIGTGQTVFNRRKDGSGFRDWAKEAFDAALAEASVDRVDVGVLVVGSESDFFTLQLNPASVLADDLGLTGVAVQRVEGGGASGHLAVQAAAALILAGIASRVGVIGFEASASSLASSSVTALYGYSFDIWADGMTGISATALYALSAQAFMARTGATTDDFAAISAGNRKLASFNPNAHLPLDITESDVCQSPIISTPYRRLDCSPLSDGAAAVILARRGGAPERRQSAPRIVGMAAASDHVRLGDRADPGFFAAKGVAARRAFAAADISRPQEQIGIAEVYDAYSGAQLQAIEGLGLSENVVEDFRGGNFGRAGRLPVNLSGGLLGQGAPVGATGVAQIAACARQLEGTYHPQLQLRNLPRFALADTHGGVATTCAVTVLEGVG